MSLVEGLQPKGSIVPVAGDLSQGHLLEAVADWCSCLQGGLPLRSALKRLADGLGARAVCLSRHSREAGGSARAVIFNAPSLKRADMQVSRSFAHCVLGRYVGRTRPASVWFSSSNDADEDPTL